MTGLCVLLGAPRSGTTWLQRLLSCSTSVVSPQETHLFRLYLEPQRRQWDAHQRRIDERIGELVDAGTVEHRLFGLPTILPRADLLAGQRLLVDSMVRRAVETRPGAGWVLEKTPSNSLVVDMIEELCPDVRYVHIVRDPRDVVGSLRAAGRSWARWAPRDAAGGARLWRRHVEGARRSQVLAPDRAVEVRYEDLLRDTATALAPVVELLALDDEPADLVCRERAREAEPTGSVFALRPDLTTRVADRPEAEPAGFRRARGERRPGLSAIDLRIVHAEVGDLARRLGYDEGWPSMRAAELGAWRASAAVQNRAGASRRWLDRHIGRSAGSTATRGAGR